MQHDKSPDDVRADSWIPTQRTGSAAQVPTGPTAAMPVVPPRATAAIPVVQPPTAAAGQQPPAAPVSPGQPGQASPAQPAQVAPRPSTAPASDETMVLPVFVTGKKPERTPVRQAVADTKLPSSERSMLVFVAALLAVGTIAIVAMMGFGLAGNGSGAAPTRTASPVASSAGALPPPATSAAPSASPTPEATSASPKPSTSKSPRHSASPTPHSLGTLSGAALVGYCQAANGGIPRPPQGDGSWSCVAGPNKPPKTFTPTAVCRTNYDDKTAYANVGTINDPTTWHCLT